MATPSARRIAADAGRQNLVEKQANKQQLRQAAKFRRRSLGGEDHLPAHRIYQNRGDQRCESRSQQQQRDTADDLSSVLEIELGSPETITD